MSRITKNNGWDQYFIYTENFALSLSIEDDRRLRRDYMEFMDLRQGNKISKSYKSLLSRDSERLPQHPGGGDAQSSGRGYGIFFMSDGGSRDLIFHANKFGDYGPISGKIHLLDQIREESPEYGDGTNTLCYRAHGEIMYDGKTWHFETHDSIGGYRYFREELPYKDVRLTLEEIKDIASKNITLP